jgi:hypothetical protein
MISEKEKRPVQMHDGRSKHVVERGNGSNPSNAVNTYPRSNDTSRLNDLKREMKLAFTRYDEAMRRGDADESEAAKVKFVQLSDEVRQATPRNLLSSATAPHQYEMCLPPPSAEQIVESRLNALDRDRRTRGFYADLDRRNYNG